MIASGAPVDRWSETIGGEDHNVWAFEIDEVWKGQVPLVVELQASAGEDSCGPAVDLEASVVRLEASRREGRYQIATGCYGYTLEPAVADRLFGSPPLFRDGLPLAIVSADAGGHAAAVVDLEGRPIRYLPGDGETHGLAPCPGGDHFVQLRGGTPDEWGLLSSFELAIWRYDGWVELAAHPVSSPEPIETAETLVCTRPDGGDATIVWSTYVDEVTRVVDGMATERSRIPEVPVEVPGPGDASFRLARALGPQVGGGSVASDVVWDLGDGSTWPIEGFDLGSVVATDDGWEIAFAHSRELPSGGWQSGFTTLTVGADGRASAASDFIPFESSGWPTGMVIPSDRRTLDGLDAVVPPPAFERTGELVEPPLEANADDAPDVTTRQSSTPRSVPDVAQPDVATSVDDVAGPTGPDDSTTPPRADADVRDGRTWPRWVAGGILAAAMLAAVALVRRRATGRATTDTAG